MPITNGEACTEVGCKECVKCNKSKPLTKEFFYISAKGAVYGYCRDCAKRQRREWSVKNKNRHSANIKRYRDKQPLNDIKERVRRLVGAALIGMGKRKSQKTIEIIGCSKEEFGIHIERQFLKGMTWCNRGEWHLDHIIPLSAAKTEEDVIRLNHHTNLRPLWALDNMKKRDKVEFLL